MIHQLIKVHWSSFSLVFYVALILAKINFTYAEILRLSKCGKFDANFSVMRYEKKLIGKVLALSKSTCLNDCIMKCVRCNS